MSASSWSLRVFAALFFFGGLLVLAGARPPSAAFAENAAAATSTDASYNWSGYVATGGEFTTVSSRWRVPEVTGSGGAAIAAHAVWVGIGGVDADDLIQTGTQAISDAGGNVIYQAWFETIPGPPSIPLPLEIAPGDLVHVSLSLVGPSRWLISMQNETTGGSYEFTTQFDSSLSSAEWVQEMPSTLRGAFIPLDEFGTVEFTDGLTTKDGKTLTIAQTKPTALLMTNLKGETLAIPSVLGGDGQSFSVARTGASAVLALEDEVRRVRTFYILDPLVEFFR